MEPRHLWERSRRKAPRNITSESLSFKKKTSDLTENCRLKTGIIPIQINAVLEQRRIQEASGVSLPARLKKIAIEPVKKAP
jgi:hypothetical protein